MRQHIRSTVGILALLGAAIAASAALADSKNFRLEPNLDRSGNDLRRDVLAADADVEVCAARCLGLAGCKSFTFVKKSTTVPAPICWLKDTTPVGYASSCCTSGVLKP